MQSQQKEKNNNKSEINETENANGEKLNETKVRFFKNKKKIKKTEKPLARWAYKKRRLELVKSEMKVETLLLILQIQEGQNRSITNKDIESVNKKPPNKEKHQI